MRYADDDLLRLVGGERKRSIGFGEGDSELSADRERAIRFYNGDVTQDIPTIPNRSAAVSTDVADAVETALPDILEVLIGGDDVATFQAQGPEDEDAAREQSEAVKHTIFAQNEGFLAFYTGVKDALLVKTGVFHWWWEDEETEDRSPPVDLEAAAVVAEQLGGEIEEQGDGTASVVVRKMAGKVCVKAVTPEDFTVAPDTVSLRDTTYCAMRDRPRVQDLIARGVDPEIARGLKSYAQPDQAVAEARDTAGEEQLLNDATADHRQVEVRSHYIRLLGDGNRLTVWRVDTDAEETVVIDKEEVDGIPFGAITPYINAHRFYGLSLADKLIEVAKIKTSLLRMFLDDGYFALNQRMTVDMTKTNEFTISDLLNNVPNMPVRTQGEGAVVPLRAGGLNFDALAALEYASTMAEQRTGVVRNAQGLNPDTLHDTAKGAMALIAAAQKRIRLIARTIAETGVKDLYIGVHALLRKGYGAETEARRALPNLKLSGGWKEINPGDWPERKGVDVQIGIGSAGREHELVVLGELMTVQKEMIAGGLGGVTVTPDNIYNAAKRFAQAANLKTPELYFTDPKTVPPQPPKPDPEMAKAQAQMQLEHAKAGANIELERAKSQATLEADAQKAANDNQLALAKMQAEMELKRYQIDAELELKRQQLVAEIELKRELGLVQAQVAKETGMAKANASSSTSDVEMGGNPG